MKLTHGRLADKAEEIWQKGGWRRRCGLLAGAFGTAYLAGLAGGNMSGFAAFGISSAATAIEERRFEAAFSEFGVGERTFQDASAREGNLDGRLKALRNKSDATGREADAVRRLMERRGLNARSLEEGIRKAVSPLDIVILKNVERQRADLARRLGHAFPSYRLLFFLQYAISEYITYRNTAGNSVPRGIGTIGESATGDCKDQSAILASLSLAAGLRVKFVSWSHEDGGHAYLFVRIFEKPSDEGIRGLGAHFLGFGRKARANMIGQGKPVLRRFNDGLYIACDPTNHLVPGLIMNEFLGPKERVKMIDFRPEDYGIAPCGK